MKSLKETIGGDLKTEFENIYGLNIVCYSNKYMADLLVRINSMTKNKELLEKVKEEINNRFIGKTVQELVDNLTLS